MAAEAEASREARAKVIAAEGKTNNLNISVNRGNFANNSSIPF